MLQCIRIGRDVKITSKIEKGLDFARIQDSL